MKKYFILLSLSAILSSAQAATLNLESSGVFRLDNVVSEIDKGGEYLLSGSAEASGLPDGTGASFKIYLGDEFLDEVHFSSNTRCEILKFLSIDSDAFLGSQILIDASISDGASIVLENIQLHSLKDVNGTGDVSDGASSGSLNSGGVSRVNYAFVNGSNVLAANNTSNVNSTNLEGGSEQMSINSTTSGGTIYVNSAAGVDTAAGTSAAPKRTIVAAMTAASSGDTVILQASSSVYTASILSASGKSITIRPASSAIIRGN